MYDLDMCVSYYILVYHLNLSEYRNNVLKYIICQYVTGNVDNLKYNVYAYRQ